MPRTALAPGAQTFIMEGGIETYMQYKKGHTLRHFCLFDLMSDARAIADLREYHVQLIEVVREHMVGAILDGIHYRASRDRGDLLGYSRQSLANIVIEGVAFYNEIARRAVPERVRVWEIGAVQAA